MGGYIKRGVGHCIFSGIYSIEHDWEKYNVCTMKYNSDKDIQ